MQGIIGVEDPVNAEPLVPSCGEGVDLGASTLDLGGSGPSIEQGTF